ncbi:hypothetical protein BXZ70DRAFT_1005608 [Cristinia sonorae]|uniref:Uncharacterized protein n=1 Tax=Cristinia sonorae TaxID=1940300 RepID=A0A8K0XSR7_9AGAR|nr:hypothetical protein BXZ70DRAFT_1005608 [Cristinia sonorae]
MVVTRKAPVPPVPASRTNSTQGIPRATKPVPDTGLVSSPLTQDTTGGTNSVNGQNQKTNVDSSPPKSGKTKGKGKHKKKSSRGKSGGFLDLLTRAFLLFFTIYTLSVCPTDEHLKSPVCRGLHEYRRLILEPYLLPPIQQVLAHPSVAPYVDRAKPYAVRFVAAAKPIALRSHQEWNARVVPQWNKRIVPQWNKHAVPLWNKYAVPQIQRAEQRLDPYLRTLSIESERRFGSHVRLAIYNLQKWRRQAQPYVVLAAQKTHAGYQKAKPYAIPLLQRAKILFAQFVQFLITQRRQFVDPHLKRIWEGVVELSGGKPVSPITNVRKPVKETPILSKASYTAHVVSSAVSSAVLPSPSSLLPQTSDASVDVASSVLPATIPISETLPATISSESDNTPVPTKVVASFSSVASAASETASSAVSAASSYVGSLAPSVAVTGTEVSSSASSLVSLLTDDAVPSATAVAKEYAGSPLASAATQLRSSASFIAESAASAFTSASASVVATITEAGSSASSVAAQAYSSVPSQVSAASETVRSAVPVPSVTSEDDDIDLDAFYAELGLDHEEEPAPADADSAALSEETESEEEKAEKLRLRLIETAEKRAAITGRHSEWEKQIEEAVEEGRKSLRKQLSTIRKAAVAELKESKEIRKEVESLVDEAEKFLKGAEKYLVTLKRESRRSEEKSTMWERVVHKVDSKFGERLGQTEAVVNGWYNTVLNAEIGEVRKASEAVKDVADRAQADLGLDYAWLDDVTYQDWQRYHDLARASENFTQLAMSIQNGSHPSSPINSVLPALEDLQAEVQDVVVGFETRLRRVKRNGDRAFGIVQGSEDTSDEGSETPADATVSILPIERDEKKAAVDDQSPPDITQFIIGRSKEEVVAALNRAAEVDPSATSVPEDKAKGAEEVVDAIASEVEEETSSSAVPHVEL